MVRRRPIITIPALRVAPSRITNPALRPLFLELFLALLVVRYFINPVGVVVPPVVALQQRGLVVLVRDRKIVVLVGSCKGREEDEVRSSEDHGSAGAPRRGASS